MAGRVRVGRIVAWAAVLEIVGIAVTAVATFLLDAALRPVVWLVGPAAAVVAAVARALVETAGPAPVHTPRRGVPGVAALLVLLTVLGAGGVGAAWAVRWGVGYVTGTEEGVDRLGTGRAPSDSAGSVSMRVLEVRHTAHFTRVRVSVDNASQETATVNLFKTAVLSAPGWDALAADPFRSSWNEQVPGGAEGQTGWIVFPGHLPAGAVTASLAIGHVSVFGEFVRDTTLRIRLPLLAVT